MGYWTNNSEHFRMPDMFICYYCNDHFYACNETPWVYIAKNKYPKEQKWSCQNCYFKYSIN
jgi:hypothetical protein